jgi:hypothetical protein
MISTRRSGEEILREAAERLESAGRVQFLAQLLWALNLELRGTYPMPPDSLERAAVIDLVCCNELLHVVQSQIRAEVGRGLGYPDAALLEELQGKSRWGDGGCQDALSSALVFALNSSSKNGTRDSFIFERAVERLASPERLQFLLHLARYLSDQVRTFAEEGSNSTEVRKRFACLGDLAVRTCDRMIAVAASGEPSSDGEAFLADMVAAANSGLCGGALRGVLESTLNALSGTVRVG